MEEKLTTNKIQEFLHWTQNTQGDLETSHCSTFSCDNSGNWNSFQHKQRQNENTSEKNRI